MKILKTTLLGFFLMGSIFSFSQGQKEKKVKEIEIKTSAQCEMCKERIENEMAFEKGVKSVELDLETKVLSVKYKTDKTDPEKLRKAVSKIGYDADDVEADSKAYERLPDCCKKGGHDHHGTDQ